MSKMTRDGKEACKKIAAKVAAQHVGQEKPQLLHRKPTEEQMLASLKGKVTEIMHVNGVRWRDPGDGWGRETCGFKITVDFTKLDRAPTKDEVVKSIQNDLDDIANHGWYFTEEAARKALVRDIERQMGHMVIEFEHNPPCPACATDFLRDFYEILRKSRIWIEEEVPSIRKKVDGQWPVIPCLDAYEIKDGKFVRKEEPKSICKCGGKCHCKKGKK